MIVMPPKELDYKIRYRDGDVFVAEGVQLTEQEQKLYEEYREKLRYAYEHQFDD